MPSEPYSASERRPADGLPAPRDYRTRSAVKYSREHGRERIMLQKNRPGHGWPEHSSARWGSGGKRSNAKRSAPPAAKPRKGLKPPLTRNNGGRDRMPRGNAGQATPKASPRKMSR